ncbi:nuclear transport factor 2 family protein [Henriciella aquimarina]|uniref:nuclear transport factor 2 family protein n=1 Tax=Henriciella aquimarina TaxID=545261 RepID=UPI000A0757D5|nr:nuclear transport factor 2 family protein [Henriciella aquimarina]
MRLLRLSRSFLTGLFVVSPAAAQSASLDMSGQKTEAAVLEVEAVRLKAMLEADVETLERITGDDYVHVESSGKVRTKTEFLDGFRNRDYRFESFVIEQNDVNMLGSVAVVTGRYHNIIETPAGVQPIKHARHVRVYALRDGQWINVTHQATEIPSN